MREEDVRASPPSPQPPVATAASFRGGASVELFLPGKSELWPAAEGAGGAAAAPGGGATPGAGASVEARASEAPTQQIEPGAAGAGGGWGSASGILGVPSETPRSTASSSASSASTLPPLRAEYGQPPNASEFRAALREFIERNNYRLRYNLFKEVKRFMNRSGPLYSAFIHQPYPTDPLGRETPVLPHLLARTGGGNASAGGAAGGGGGGAGAAGASLSAAAGGGGGAGGGPGTPGGPGGPGGRPDDDGSADESAGGGGDSPALPATLPSWGARGTYASTFLACLSTSIMFAVVPWMILTSGVGYLLYVPVTVGWALAVRPLARLEVSLAAVARRGPVRCLYLIDPRNAPFGWLICFLGIATVLGEIYFASHALIFALHCLRRTLEWTATAADEAACAAATASPARCAALARCYFDALTSVCSPSPIRAVLRVYYEVAFGNGDADLAAGSHDRVHWLGLATVAACTAVAGLMAYGGRRTLDPFVRFSVFGVGLVVAVVFAQAVDETSLLDGAELTQRFGASLLDWVSGAKWRRLAVDPVPWLVGVVLGMAGLGVGTGQNYIIAGKSPRAASEYVFGEKVPKYFLAYIYFVAVSAATTTMLTRTFYSRFRELHILDERHFVATLPYGVFFVFFPVALGQVPGAPMLALVFFIVLTVHNLCRAAVLTSAVVDAASDVAFAGRTRGACCRGRCRGRAAKKGLTTAAVVAVLTFVAAVPMAVRGGLGALWVHKLRLTTDFLGTPLLTLILLVLIEWSCGSADVAVLLSRRAPLVRRLMHAVQLMFVAALALLTPQKLFQLTPAGLLLGVPAVFLGAGTLVAALVLGRDGRQERRGIPVTRTEGGEGAGAAGVISGERFFTFDHSVMDVMYFWTAGGLELLRCSVHWVLGPTPGFASTSAGNVLLGCLLPPALLTAVCLNFDSGFVSTLYGVNGISTSFLTVFAVIAGASVVFRVALRHRDKRALSWLVPPSAHTFDTLPRSSYALDRQQGSPHLHAANAAAAGGGGGERAAGVPGLESVLGGANLQRLSCQKYRRKPLSWLEDFKSADAVWDYADSLSLVSWFRALTNLHHTFPPPHGARRRRGLASDDTAGSDAASAASAAEAAAAADWDAAPPPAAVVVDDLGF